MNFQYSPYIIPLLLAALVSLWIAYFAWARRGSQIPVYLSLLALAITVWLVGYALEIAGADLPTKRLWGEFQYIGISYAPLMWFAFAYLHSNRNRSLSLTARAFFLVIPTITMLLALTTHRHGLLWQTIEVFREGSFSALQVTHGPWFWVHSIYSYLLLLAGAVYLFRSLGSKRGVYRGQFVALLVAVLSPWVGNAVYLAGLSPVPFLDLTPFAFTVTLISLTYAIFNFSLINLSPFARDFVMERMDDGVIVFDTADRVTDINPAAQRLLGKAQDWGAGLTVQEALSFAPQLIDGYDREQEHLGVFRMGELSPRWYDFHLSPLKDGHQNQIGQIMTIYDVTARKEVEESLALARDQALEANQFKGQMLAKISHELRTPLGAILGFSELMRNGNFGPLNEKQLLATEQISQSVEYLKDMVNELLDEAQISAQKMVLRVEPFSPRELLRRVEGQAAVLAGGKGLDFSVSIAPELPETLYGDAARIQQILLNLAGNAIKFTQAGRVWIEAARPDPGHWSLTVSDSGMGIPQDSLELIFEPFRQVDTALQGENRGTGLGLTITRQLVELMGGKISAESEVGQGSAFTVLLPLIESQEAVHG